MLFCRADLYNYFDASFYFMGIPAVILNLLIFCLIFKQPMESRFCTNLIIIQTALNMLFTLDHLAFKMAVHNGQDYVYYITFSEYLYNFHDEMLFREMFFHNFIKYMYLSLLPVQFFYRYQVLISNGVTKIYKTLGAMALAVGYSLVDSTWLMPFVEINGDKSDKELLQGGCDTSSIHKHVVFSKRLPGASTYSTLHRAYVIGSSVIVLYYGTITILHIRKVYHAMSRKAIVLNHRLNRLFCVQLIMLIGLNVLPMIGFIFTDSVSTLLGNIIGIARAFGLGIFPLVDALVIIMVFPSFQRQLFYRCLSKHRRTSIISLRTISFLT